jgi:hypothetical protein
MLTQIDLSIDDLVLDPHNPRFASDFTPIEAMTDQQLIASEKDTLQRFTPDESTTKESTTAIGDLFRSMKEIGYVPIDRVVVKKIGETGKYLVIEGNRRISTVKQLLSHLVAQDLTHEELQQLQRHEQSFRVIPCKLIATENKSKKEIDHAISVILGIRHHGSLLEWEPLPRAYNIYTEYMSISGGEDAKFQVDTIKIKDIASRLSISSAKVSSALQTYIAYLQLSSAVPGRVAGEHYSLIETAISNRSLRASFITQRPETYELDSRSIDQLNTLLQFELRDNANYSGKKIIHNVSDVRAFGNLVQRRSEAKHPATRDFIQAQIDGVLDLNDPTTIDQANDAVTDYLNRSRWVEAVNKLLDDREQKLPVTEFTGVGNDLASLDELKKRLELITRLHRA